MLPQFSPSRYRRLWWLTLLSVSVPAMALTLCVSPIPCLVLGAVVAGVYLGSFVLGVAPAWHRWRATTAGPLLLVAAVPVLGWTALPLVLLAAASSPPVVVRLVGGRDVVAEQWMRRRSRDTGRESGPEVAACLEAMSGPELCRLWGTSFSLVKSPTRLSERVVGAGLRLSLLDDLERRDSEGFASWLARRPSPASAPSWILASPEEAHSPPAE